MHVNFAQFKRIVDAPHFPHAHGEVRIEVAVEDGIARGLVTIASAAVRDLISEAGAGSNSLTVKVVGIRVVPIVLPLMSMQVEDVMFLGSRV